MLSLSGVPLLAQDDIDKVWDTSSIDWTGTSSALHVGGKGRSLAVKRGVGAGNDLTIESTITPRRSIASSWKLAGILLKADEGNFWHLALAEGPDVAGKSHFIELTEMLENKWLSQSNLKQSDHPTVQKAWEYGRSYKLKIILSHDGIAGDVTDAATGERIFSRDFAFIGAAVGYGRPGLTSDSLEADFADFKADIRSAVVLPAALSAPKFTSLSNHDPVASASGYFKTANINDKWWLVDPTGRPFYAVATDHVNYNVHFTEKLGYAEYHRNVETKFGTEAKWAENEVARLKLWGFNTLGTGCGESTYHRGLPHTEFLGLGANFTSVGYIAERTTWTGFPDVFHPDFERWCRKAAELHCIANKSDPWLLGYFLDNELEWLGKNYTDGGLADEALKLLPGAPARAALISFVKQRYSDFRAFNIEWKTALDSWDDLETGKVTFRGAASEKANSDKLAFVQIIADRYFKYTSAAIRAADPNHMVLGCRFAGTAPPGVIAAAGRYCDVVSINYYGQVDQERSISTDMPGKMDAWYAEAKRPIMVTEWSFPALDAGLPSVHGAGQRVATQADKARCFTIYQRSLFTLPYMVGSSWFMWADEPALGISSTFPEDSNYGLVDVRDNAWPEITVAAAKLNPSALAMHAHETALLKVSIASKLGTNSVTVANTGTKSASAQVEIWVQGKRTFHDVTVAAHAQVSLPIQSNSPAFVSARVDAAETVMQWDRSGNYAEKIINVDRAAKPSLLFVNPADTKMENPVSTLTVPSNTDAIAVKGAGIQQQVDVLPDHSELTIMLPSIEAKSVIVLPVTKDGFLFRSNHSLVPDRDIDLPGTLHLHHSQGQGDLFDIISVGSTPVGRYQIVVHEGGKQNLWVSPNNILAIESFEGPVRSIYVFTTRAGQSGVKTAVDPNGKYAEQQTDARRFDCRYRLVVNSKQSYFTSQFVSLTNSDFSPLNFDSYYHYATSAVAGDAGSDQPRNNHDASFWWNSKQDVAYGVVAPSELFKMSYWKDTPDGKGEHPDVWRDIKRDLKPGETVRATAEDAAVTVFIDGKAGNPPAAKTIKHLRELNAIKLIPIGLW